MKSISGDRTKMFKVWTIKALNWKYRGAIAYAIYVGTYWPWH